MRMWIYSVLLAGGLLLGLQGGASAISPPSVSEPGITEKAEARAFFEQLLNTTSNPLIASIARDSLDRLVTHATAVRPAAYMPARDTHTEITLLPQNDNTYVVPAVINKRVMATFLVDTGASYTVITPQTAQALGVEIYEDTPTVPVTTANGTIQAPLVTLKNVSLGGLHVTNVEAVIADLGEAPQLSGLLGMSFFSGMDLTFSQDRLIISR